MGTTRAYIPVAETLAGNPRLTDETLAQLVLKFPEDSYLLHRVISNPAAGDNALIAAANRSNSVYAPTASRRDSDNGVLARVSATDTTPEVVYRRGGDDNVLVEYGPMTLDLGLRMRIYALMQSLTERAPAGLIDQ